MGFLKKIGHSLRHGFSVGSPKKIFGKKGYKWVKNPFRAAQRSHKLGHTLAPSWSDSNQITRVYNKLMNKLGKSAERSMARNTNTNSAQIVRSQTSMPLSTSQRLNYNYRRLSDIT